MIRSTILACTFVALIAGAAQAQSRSNPLGAEPAAGELNCKQVIYVKSGSCPSGVQKVVGSCSMKGHGGGRERSCA